MPTVDGPALLAAAEAILPQAVAIRREIHRRPETGLQLPATQELIAGELDRLGLRATPGRSITSLTSVIEGARPGPTILLRADMDALPLTEDTGLSFASAIDGTMHACGHDLHVAMLLAAAGLLVERRGSFAGRVVLMFQPGEEGFGGARIMLEEGLLETASEPPGAAFAIHIGTRYASGVVAARPGPMLASSDTLRITVSGRGGHASTPHLALDPITVAAEILLALQAMVTRRIDVFDPAVVTIARVTAGTTTNIIPETATLEGTIRTVSGDTRERVIEAIRRVVDGVSAAHGATSTTVVDPGYPVTLNDDAFTAFAMDVAAGIAGHDRLKTLRAPIMGAEDFSYVLQRLPGAMFFVGARPADQDPATAPQNHSNRVVFDEPAMATGIALYAGVALDWLAAQS